MIEPKVLFVTDFDGDLRAGLALATRLATDRTATLVIMHVVPISSGDGEATLHRALDSIELSPERRLRAIRPASPGVPFLHVLEGGDPESAIVAYANRERVDMIVVEARPRGVLRRALGRSLGERLIESAPCPVVTHRGAARAVRRRPVRRSHAARPLSPEDLTTILHARISALVSWATSSRRAACDVADSASVRHAVASLARTRRGDALSSVVRRALLLELSEHRRALGALGVRVEFGGASLVALGQHGERDGAYARFLARAIADGSAVSLPLDDDAPGARRCVIVVGARVELGGGELAVLTFTFDARRDFLRILAQPGPAPSVETYAFDRDGLMLSNSRFPDQLRRIGLLPADPGVQTPRRLRLWDPGRNLLLEGVGLAPPLPLTRMAAAATSGVNGYDWDGYRDYRGVEVVGAWRWVTELNIGVAAEMDRVAS